MELKNDVYAIIPFLVISRPDYNNVPRMCQATTIHDQINEIDEFLEDLKPSAGVWAAKDMTCIAKHMSSPTHAYEISAGMTRDDVDRLLNTEQWTIDVDKWCDVVFVGDETRSTIEIDNLLNELGEDEDLIIDLFKIKRDNGFVGPTSISTISSMSKVVASVFVGEFLLKKYWDRSPHLVTDSLFNDWFFNMGAS